MGKLITLGLINPPLELRGNPLESPSVPLGSVSALWAWLSGSAPTASGEMIDVQNSLEIISVQAAVKLISQTIAGLPLKLYKKLPRGREEAVDNPLYDLLALEPNPEMGAFSFWQAVVSAMAMCGNAYVYCQRVQGQVEALWILNPHVTKPVRLPNGELAFETREGTNFSQTKIYSKNDVLHFKYGVSFDGLLGYSPIQLARQELGLNKASLKAGGRVFQNGRPSGVMTTDATNIDEKMLLNLRESWQASQTGENAGKCAFLSHGFKYTPISMSLEDMEFIKTRIHSRTEVAALFNLAPHQIGDTSRLGGNNAEQENLNFLSLCLRSYIAPIENEIQRILLPRFGRNAGAMFVRFDTSELLRCDIKTRNESAALARQWGIQNANEVRDDWEIPHMGPEGDVYWAPVNMQNAGNLVEVIRAVPATPNKANPHLNAPEDTTANQLEPGPDTTKNERSIAKLTVRFLPVFKDSIGRLLHREKRTLDTISSCLTPVLRSLTDVCIDFVNEQIGSTWRDETVIEKILSDVTKSIEKRQDKWSSEADQLAPEEFRKILKQIVSSVYREVGASLVLSEVN